jgi:hypothetical protein
MPHCSLYSTKPGQHSMYTTVQFCSEAALRRRTHMHACPSTAVHTCASRAARAAASCSFMDSWMASSVLQGVSAKQNQLW